MNRLEQFNIDGKIEYRLTCDGGDPVSCTVITEKKTGKDYVKLPKNNESGRTFVSVSNFNDSNVYEFETKTEHRTGLTGGGWKSKLTPEETTEIQMLEDRIAAIKTEAMKRETPKVDKDSEEGLEAAIAKLQAKLAAKKAAKPTETTEPTTAPTVKKSKKA